MEIKVTDEFASTMQQLSAEAEKTLPEISYQEENASAEAEKTFPEISYQEENASAEAEKTFPEISYQEENASAEAEKTFPGISYQEENASAGQYAQILEEFRRLNGRLQNLEETVTSRLEKLSNAEPADLAAQFRKMDEHYVALRNTESVNQRLFDSLHEELIKYRDNFVYDSLQKPFIRGLLVLFDDLSALSSQLQAAIGGSEGKRGKPKQWHENLENTIHSLTEILHRMEVSEIEPREMVDRTCHRVMSFEPTDDAEADGQIVARIKRGFLWRNQVLRAEEVVAKRFQ